MPWVKRIKIGPVKHFYSFINNAFQLICTLSTQCVGAVAVPDFLIYAEYFIRKDFGPKWYEDENTVKFIKQAFQHFIYSVNNSFRGNQSPFTNVSVYDKYWLESLFANHMNPDFTNPDLENAMRVQKIFVEELINQLQDNPFTFPVMTAASLIDPETKDFKDKEWLDWLCEVSVKNKCLNFFQDDTTSSISSCCIKGSGIIKVINKKTNGTEIFTIEDFVNLFNENKDNNEFQKVFNNPQYQIYSYNFDKKEWQLEDINGVLKKKCDSLGLVKIELEDNKFVEVTPDHIFTVHKISTDEIIKVTAGEIYNNPSDYEIGVEN